MLSLPLRVDILPESIFSHVDSKLDHDSRRDKELGQKAAGPAGPGRSHENRSLSPVRFHFII